MNAISCVQLESLLTEYFDDALTPPEIAAIEEHLATCQACGAMVEDTRLALRYTRNIAELEAPPQLVARIIEQTTGAAGAFLSRVRHASQ